MHYGALAKNLARLAAGLIQKLKSLNPKSQIPNPTWSARLALPDGIFSPEMVCGDV